MGYSTDFKGELKFTTLLSAPALAQLKNMFGEDCRDHPEWDAQELRYIDLEFNDDFSGIRWDGAEKTYALDQVVNLILRVMSETWPEFGLSGSLVAQGEEISDRWHLVIGADGTAEKREIAIQGNVITCPSCDHKFEI